MTGSRLRAFVGCMASMLLGACLAMTVFGVSLGIAWTAILRENASLRLWSVVVAGALGIFSGSLAVGFLGRLNRIKRAVGFSLILSVMAFTYLFSFSQVTAVLVVIGGLLGLMCGVAANALRRRGAGSPPAGEA